MKNNNENQTNDEASLKNKLDDLESQLVWPINKPTNEPSHDDNDTKYVEINKQNKKSHSSASQICLILAITLASGALGFLGGNLAINLAGQKKEELSDNTSIPVGPLGPGSSMPYYSVADIAKKNGESVVEIITENVKSDKSIKEFTSSGAGSGIIITDNGYIATNNHVISGVKKITVILENGEKVQAEVVGTDKELDIAIIKVDKENLLPASFGYSSSLNVGDGVIAIGNPLGQLGGTVTDGIISALSRDVTINNQTLNLLQTNAAVNPGNSGGGLFNMHGQLIGMVVAKPKTSNTEGIGFAIPIDNIRKPMQDILDSGYVKGRVKIEMSLINASSINPPSIYKSGVVVTKVPKGSSEEAAGFKINDCIVSIESNDLVNLTEFNRLIKKYPTGKNISVGILRNNNPMTLTFHLVENSPS